MARSVRGKANAGEGGETFMQISTKRVVPLDSIGKGS
jgi:hypothetical protein